MVRSRPAGRWRAVAGTGALVVVLTAWNNVVVTRLPGPYVAVNGTAAAVLLATARAAGLRWSELGLARRCLPAGLRAGGACVALVAGAYAVGLAVPALRPLLGDARVADLDGGEIASRTLVRIPFGTVLWEEVAFRGVLLAALLRLLPVPAAVGVAAAVFGSWHIRPTLGALEANDLVHGPAATTAVVVLACLATAAAGVLFAWLRLRSGSLLAPVLLHLATNSVGLLAAAAAVRLA